MITRYASSDGVGRPVRVSTIAARVEKFVPAYESPPTNAVQAANRPLGETLARDGIPGTS